MRQGLDGLWVFHTLFHHRVTPLAERTWPMWLYNGLADPDRASPEELPNDEVWSRLNRVLQLRPKESLDGNPGALNASRLSKMVRSPFLTLCSFQSRSPIFLTSCRPSHRDLEFTSPSCTF